MKARMAQAERTCVSRECVENRRKGTKNKKKTPPQESNDNAQSNLRDNAPKTNKKSKATNSNDEAPKNFCPDQVAHIATDMMQIQSIPKLQVGTAYYRSKVNKEISIPNN